MAEQLNLSNVGSLQDTTTAATTINNNFTAIETALQDVLSLSGTAPNQMQSTLDMNSNPIVNLPAPTTSTSPLRLSDVTLLNGGGTINAVPTGGATSQVLTKNSNTSYDISWENPYPSGGGTGQILTKNSNTNFDTSWQNISTGLPNPGTFGGRLTLVSGQPVMNSGVDVIGAQTLYYAPYVGKIVPTYNGSWSLSTFTSSSSDLVGLSLSLAGSSTWATNSIHDVFAYNTGSNIVLGTRLWDSSMYPTTVLITPATTITSGTTGTWTNASNAFNGTTSQPSSTCATIVSNNSNAQSLGQDWGSGNTNVITQVVVYAPTDNPILGDGPSVEGFYIMGSNDNVNWHLISIWRGNDSALGNAIFTIPLNITEQQPCRYHRVAWDGNGSNTIRIGQVQFYKNVPAVTRRLTKQDGILVNDASMTLQTGPSTMITVPANQGTYLGSIHIDPTAPGQITAHQTYGLSRLYGVWNYYNRVPVKLVAGSYAANYSGSTLLNNYYTPSTTQLWNSCESTIGSGSGFNTTILAGVAEESARGELIRAVYMNASSQPCSYESAIGVDTNLNMSGTEATCNLDATGQAIGFIMRAFVEVPPFAGLHTLYAIERQGNSGTGGQSAFTGPRNTQLTATWRA